MTAANRPTLLHPRLDSPRAFRTAILSALGNAPEAIEPGRMLRFSTNGKRGDLAGWCLLFVDGRAGIYGCHRTGLSAVWTATERRLMSRAENAELARQVQAASDERKRLQAQAWAEQGPRNARLWAHCSPVNDDGSGADPVTTYLRNRLAMPHGPLHVPQALRLHAGLDYRHDGNLIGAWPAMVAAMVNPAGELVALHRTWITTDGRKAAVPGPVKKLTSASGTVAGGCVPLYAMKDGVLGIAEGIETAMAARQASGLPTVAAYSAGALAAWQWPRGLRRLVIFADNDPAGAEAADKLRARALGARISVDVLAPSEAGLDWCDVWARRPQATEVRA